MSFQAYLDAVEAKTGLTPRELVDLARERGFDASTKAAPIVEWLAATISEKHVGTDGVHRDESVELWLDGKASKPS